MKRDPRLRRGGERRGERRLGQGATARRVDALHRERLRIYRLFGLTRHQRRLAESMARVQRAAEATREAFVEILQAQAEAYADELTEQLRRDGTLYGEAYVKVGWDDAVQAPTVERVDPASIVPSLAYPPRPTTREPWSPQVSHPEAEGADWFRQRMLRRDELLGEWPNRPPE